MTETKRLRSASSGYFRTSQAGRSRRPRGGRSPGARRAGSGSRRRPTRPSAAEATWGTTMPGAPASRTGLMEDVSDPRHAHEDGPAPAPGHHQVGAHRLRPHGGVFQVDPQEVDHVRKGLADLGIGEGQGGAHQGLAGLQPSAEVVDAVEDHGANGSRSPHAGPTCSQGGFGIAISRAKRV